MPPRFFTIRPESSRPSLKILFYKEKNTQCGKRKKHYRVSRKSLSCFWKTFTVFFRNLRNGFRVRKRVEVCRKKTLSPAIIRENEYICSMNLIKKKRT